MVKKVNIKSLKAVANAVVKPVEDKEQRAANEAARKKALCAEYLEEINANIKPLFDAYRYAYAKTQGRSNAYVKGRNETEIIRDEMKPEVRISLYRGTSSWSQDNMRLRFELTEGGYVQRDYRGGYLAKGLTLDSVTEIFTDYIKGQSDDFKKHFAAYIDYLERKQKPFLQRWGITKSKAPSGN